MDSLTHTLAGLAMAEAGLARKYGPGAAFVLVLASNLPDIDALWVRAYVADGEGFLHRRMLTHSLFGLPLISAAGAAAVRVVWKRISRRLSLPRASNSPGSSSSISHSRGRSWRRFSFFSFRAFARGASAYSAPPSPSHPPMSFSAALPASVR